MNYLAMPLQTHWDYEMYQCYSSIIEISQAGNHIQLILEAHNPSLGNCTFQFLVAEVNSDGSFIRWLNPITTMPEFASWGGAVDKTITNLVPRADNNPYAQGTLIVIDIRRYDGNPVYLKSIDLQII